MKKCIWLLLLMVILLAGCDEGYVPAYGVNLYAQAAGGQATMDAAQAMVQATQAAAFERSAQATMGAAATQGSVKVELELLQGRLDATRQAQDLAMGQAGATQSAYWMEATRSAQDVRKTVEAVEAQATQTAVALDLRETVQESNRREARQELLGRWLPVIGLIALAALLVMLVQFGLRVMDWVLEWRDRKMRLFETRQGTVAFFPGEDGFWEPRLLIGPAPFDYGAAKNAGFPLRVPHLPKLRPGPSDGEVVRLTASGSVLGSSPGRIEPGVSGLAIIFLREAVAVVGEHSEVIPGWRNLPGWSSDKWQRVVAALEAAGAVETQHGVGTRVMEGFQDVGNLLYLVETRQVKVRPVGI